MPPLRRRRRTRVVDVSNPSRHSPTKRKVHSILFAVFSDRRDLPKSDAAGRRQPTQDRNPVALGSNLAPTLVHPLEHVVDGPFTILERRWRCEPTKIRVCRADGRSRDRADRSLPPSRWPRGRSPRRQPPHRRSSAARVPDMPRRSHPPRTGRGSHRPVFAEPEQIERCRLVPRVIPPPKQDQSQRLTAHGKHASLGVGILQLLSMRCFDEFVASDDRAPLEVATILVDEGL